MVVLGVENESELAQWEGRLDKYATFVEPDLGGQRTALATMPPEKIFRELKLYK